MLQSRRDSPTQSSPPLTGEGSVHVLVLLPPPQLTLQPPQGLHPPSTGSTAPDSDLQHVSHLSRQELSHSPVPHPQFLVGNSQSIVVQY